MNISAGVIQDVYYTCSLWGLSPHIRWLRQLDGNLVIELGNRHNADELIRLLNVIERTNLYVQPRWWNKRYQRTPQFCPGRVGGEADFIYYDPWRHCTVIEAESTGLVKAPRPYIPDGHPTGVSFDVVLDGRELNDQAAVDNREAWHD